MRIELRWGRDPGWYYTLDYKTREKLIAEYRISNETGEQRQKRQERIKSDKIRKMMDNHRREHGQ